MESESVRHMKARADMLQTTRYLRIGFWRFACGALATWMVFAAVLVLLAGYGVVTLDRWVLSTVVGGPFIGYASMIHGVVRRIFNDSTPGAER